MTVGESQKTQLKEVTTGHRADLLCVDNMTYISYFNDNSLRWASRCCCETPVLVTFRVDYLGAFFVLIEMMRAAFASC
jgi:hypothetical protein